jgi:hypothetical protein
VQRENAALLLRGLGFRLESRRDCAMQLPTQLERQALVRRVAQQRVAKTQVPVGLFVEQFAQLAEYRRIGRRTILFV